MQTVIILQTVRRVSECSGHSRDEVVGGFSAEARLRHPATVDGISAAAIDALIDEYRAGVAIVTRDFPMDVASAVFVGIRSLKKILAP
jgi:hypothetical protein